MIAKCICMQTMSDRVTVSSLIDRFEQINHRIEAEVFRDSKWRRKSRLQPASSVREYLHPRIMVNNHENMMRTQFSIVAPEIDIDERIPSIAMQPTKRCRPRKEDSHYVSLSQLRKKLALVHFGDEISTDDVNEGRYLTIAKYRSAKTKVENYKVTNKDEVQMQEFKTKKEYVVDELITTEEEYVRKLEYAIDNYYDFLATNNPKDAKNIFQNLHAICTDTKRFLHRLKTLRHCYEAIGVHFLKSKSMFERYLLYIRDKRVSELQCEKSKELIKKREEDINDMHGLSSYLLRPIQRLAKYELLLKKLAKHVNEPKQIKRISEAANLIRLIASKGNDIIELDLIKGKPRHFGSTGNLLLRDHFREHTHFRCDIVVFLFRRKLILTRKDNKIIDNYLFLTAIDTRSLGIIPGDDRPNAFTLQSHHRDKITNYRLTARTCDIKSKWVKEIQVILWKQLEERKSKTCLTKC